MISLHNFELAVPAGSIQTPLESATPVRAGWSSAMAAKFLAAREFDQAPVLSGPNVVGYALLSELRRRPKTRVRGVMRGINQGVLLSAGASMRTLVDLLNEREFAFIVGDQGVSGFVTPSDLNKHAARAHFYLVLAALEIALSDLLRRSGDQDAFLDLLGPSARETVERRFAEDQQADTDVDYVAYFEFSSLLQVVGRTDPLRAVLGFESSADWRRATYGLVRLRHDVMHPTRELYGPRRTLRDLVAADNKVRDLLQAVSRVPQAEAARPAVRRTLHEAITVVLREIGRPVPAREIAREINARQLYLRGDGADVPPNQVSARISKYPHLFVRTGRGIRRRAPRPMRTRE